MLALLAALACVLHSATWFAEGPPVARRVASLVVLLALLAPASQADAVERRKVLAHYHWFPVSVDNAPLPDLYACWLTPACERGKYAYSGGFLRDRPPFRAPRAGPDWRLKDKAGEVTTAKAAGIDGFTFNIVS